MRNLTIRDCLWLWDMKVNVLQQGMMKDAGWPDSTLTTEQAIQRTGITNVLMAGQLELNEETLASMPSAKRIICKWQIHFQEDGVGNATLDTGGALENLYNAKRLAAQDTRIDCFLLDDFSSVSVSEGVAGEHLEPLLLANAVTGPLLPLMGTVYTMSLDDERLPPLLPYFSSYLTPLWHAGAIGGLEADVDRLAGMSSRKPQLLCIYLYDYGNGEMISAELMRRQLEVATDLLARQKVFGVVILGTCTMDLDWPSCHAFYEWLDKNGDTTLDA